VLYVVVSKMFLRNEMVTPWSLFARDAAVRREKNTFYVVLVSTVEGSGRGVVLSVVVANRLKQGYQKGRCHTHPAVGMPAVQVSV